MQAAAERHGPTLSRLCVPLLAALVGNNITKTQNTCQQQQKKQQKSIIISA